MKEINTYSRVPTINLRSLMVAVCILVYTVGFSIVFNFDFNDVIFCIAHAILAIITTNCVFNSIELTQKYRNISFSLGGLCLYTINMYFLLSTVKYGTEMVYVEFIDDNWFRFTGTIICFISIMLTNYALRQQQRRCRIIGSKQSDMSIRSNMTLTTIAMIITCAVLLYGSIKEGTHYNTIREWDTPVEATIAIFRDVISYLVLTIAVNEIKKRHFYSYIPVALFVICVLICAIISGSRTDFVRPIIVVVYTLIVLNKINIRSLRLITCLAPIGIILMSIFIFSLSERFDNGGFNLDTISKNMGYRFDLSDFAMNCMSRSQYVKIDFSNLWSGILQSIPSALLPSGFKNENVIAYTNMLNNIGLPSWKDYTDTYFSMGAEVFGVFGMLFMPIIFVSIFEKIDYFATRKYAQGILIRVSIAMWATTIERSWGEMMPLLRNVVIYIIIAMVFENLLIRYRKRTGRSNNLSNA